MSQFPDTQDVDIKSKKKNPKHKERNEKFCKRTRKSFKIKQIQQKVVSFLPINPLYTIPVIFLIAQGMIFHFLKRLRFYKGLFCYERLLLTLSFLRILIFAASSLKSYHIQKD